ncbi:hypothetical protein [Streptomyces sp. NPDC052693]|uniref:hypothetical protein n=1 Tax=Streptomyces sp. NPDC052693 TaxID=3155814 RepID=UPI003439B506
MATAVAPDLALLAPELTIDELNQLAAAGPQALRITITPSLAKALLKQNTKNRNLRGATGYLWCWLTARHVSHVGVQQHA